MFPVEEGDYVVDLGCSMGIFYFKVKHKNVDYVGIEAAQNSLSEFSSLLTSDDNVSLMNRVVSERKTGVINIGKNNFDDGKETEAEGMTFKEIVGLRDRRIDFLKFDIESEEIEILNNDDSYELFIKNVSKFSGELHRTGGIDHAGWDPNSIKVLKKLKDDKRVDLRINSIDGLDITNYFWKGVEDDRHKYYTEVIISGKISWK